MKEIRGQGQGQPSKDRPSRGGEHECSKPRTQAQVFFKKKLFLGDLKKKVFKKFFASGSVT